MLIFFLILQYNHIKLLLFSQFIMAPPLKCYGGKRNLSRSTSESAVNALFAKNIFERNHKKSYALRRKKMPEISDLPDIVPSEHKLLNDTVNSFHVQGMDNTFDRLERRYFDKLLRSCNENEQKNETATRIEENKVDSPCDDTVFDFSQDLDFQKIIHSSLKRSKSSDEIASLNESGLSYTQMFNVPSYISVSGSAKRKNSSEKHEKSLVLDSIVDSSLDISINKIQKKTQGLGKFVVCSTPLTTNRKLKRQEILSPIKVHDCASNNLLEKSVRQIYDWSYKPPDPTAYEMVARHRRLRTRRLSMSINKPDISSGPSSVVSKKYANNSTNIWQKNQENLYLSAARKAIVCVPRLPEEEVLRLMTRQFASYKNSDLIVSNTEVTDLFHDITCNKSIIGKEKSISLIEPDPERNINFKRTKYLVTSLETFEDFYNSIKDSVVLDITNNSNQNRTNMMKSLTEKRKWDATDISNCVAVPRKQVSYEGKSMTKNESTNSLQNKSRFINKRRRYPRKAKIHLVQDDLYTRMDSNLSHLSSDHSDTDVKNVASGGTYSSAHATDAGEPNIQSSALYEEDDEDVIETDNLDYPLTKRSIKFDLQPPKLEKMDVRNVDEESHQVIVKVVEDINDKPPVLEPEEVTSEAVGKAINVDTDDTDEGKDDDSDFIQVCNSIPKRTEIIKRVQLPAGKTWRRSLASYKRNTLLNEVLEGQTCTCKYCKQSNLNEITVGRKSTFTITITSSGCRQNNNFHRRTCSRKTRYERDRRRETVALEKLIEDISLNVSQLNVAQPNTTARELVLSRCRADKPQDFSKCYTKKNLSNCRKIGEGVYGEVFLFRNTYRKPTVMKVIPIEGDVLVNGEKQKKFEEIISEIIIASELSNLRDNAVNSTTAFNEVYGIKCVKGKYPAHLLELWDIYNEDKGSENDSPEIFDDKQLYIVLELAFGGTDLESFVFKNFCEVYNVFIQIALSLAVAEEELQFEHRDLHWGNVLVTKVDKREKCMFNICGNDVILPSHGVQGTIIDFTLSRITYGDICMFNDLSQDPDLFNAEGDYQFEIYRLMQKNNGNNWETFSPYSNVLWLHYLLLKMTTSVNFEKKKIAARDKIFLSVFGDWEESLLSFKSVKQFVVEAILPKLDEFKKNAKKI